MFLAIETLIVCNRKSPFSLIKAAVGRRIVWLQVRFHIFLQSSLLSDTVTIQPTITLLATYTYTANYATPLIFWSHTELGFAIHLISLCAVSLVCTLQLTKAYVRCQNIQKSAVIDSAMYIYTSVWSRSILQNLIQIRCWCQCIRSGSRG